MSVGNDASRTLSELRPLYRIRSDQIIPAINQLCAVYQEAPVRVGLKSFDVFRGFYEEYVRIQEQVFLAREQTRSAEQRPVQETNNLLNYAHDLLEGLIRRLAALGTFSLDVLSGRENADETRTPMTIPNHPFLKGSTLRTICRQAGINREEFLREAFVSAFPTGIR